MLTYNILGALFASVLTALLPSQRQGLPKSLIEAAAYALPLVVTSVPGWLAHRHPHAVDGLPVPVKDSSAPASAIERLHQKTRVGPPVWAGGQTTGSA